MTAAQCASLSDAELIRMVDNDSRATERERVLVERLNMAHEYIHEIQKFLVTNDLAEIQVVTVQ